MTESEHSTFSDRCVDLVTTHPVLGVIVPPWQCPSLPGAHPSRICHPLATSFAPRWRHGEANRCHVGNGRYGMFENFGRRHPNLEFALVVLCGAVVGGFGLGALNYTAIEIFTK